MDWGRYERALMALHVRSIEEKRIMHVQGLLKSEHMTPADWEAINRHEEILSRWPANLG